MKARNIWLMALILGFTSFNNDEHCCTSLVNASSPYASIEQKSNFLLSPEHLDKLNKYYALQVKNMAFVSPCSGDETDNLLETFSLFGNALADQFPMTETDEKKYGDAMANEIKQSYKFSGGHDRLERIQKIAIRLLPFRTRKAINYTFHLVADDSIVNAFTVSGAHVYVTTGLLNFVNSDDELAAILGHEIAHSDKKHCTRKLQLLILGERSLGDYGKLAANFALVLGSPFGQSDEYEADREGALLAHKAGYDKKRFTDFFAKMQLREGKYNRLEKLLRTHPYSKQREDCLKEYIDKELK
jgi:hypothetical protein